MQERVTLTLTDSIQSLSFHFMFVNQGHPFVHFCFRSPAFKMLACWCFKAEMWENRNTDYSLKQVKAKGAFMAFYFLEQGYSTRGPWATSGPLVTSIWPTYNK